MPSIKKLHLENNLHPDKDFHLVHVYDTSKKDWIFMGYNCIKCGRTVKNPNLVERHQNNCKATEPTTYGKDPEPIIINDVTGKPWKPYDFNHN